MPRSAISNREDVIDSRDVIVRIEELAADLESVENEREAHAKGLLEEWEELVALKALAEQAESSPDWEFGEALIRDSYFVTYTQELVDDCFPLPKDFESGAWPWRHMTMNWEAAAAELQTDYFDVDFHGVTYWIRS